MIISFWLFGIPLGWVLAFAKHQGLPGLYQGFLAGLATSAAVEVGLGAFWIDYEQEAVNAQKRNNKAAQELHGETVAAI